MAVSVEKEAPEAPGPRGLPLMGSALDLLRDFLGTTMEGRRRYGDVVRYIAGPPGPMRITAYGFAHPDHVQHVLAGGAHLFGKQDAGYREIRAMVGDGLLTSEGETWRRQKRLIQPLFTHKRVAGYAGMMAEESRLLVERWEGLRAAGGAVDLHPEMTRFSLRVVSRALFGDDMDRVVPVLRDNVPYLSRKAFNRSLAPVHIPEEWPTPGNRHRKRALAQIHEAVDDMIDSRRADPGGYDDMLSLLLAAQDPEGGAGLSDGEVHEQALIFLLAGHETTATSLTFTLHLLGLHHGIQDGVREEAVAVFGSGLPDHEDSAKLVYATKVIKEAMRLYPAVYAIPRLVNTTHELGGYRVPAGAVAAVSPWVTHRHPGFWDDPDTFDPERFTPEKERARHRYAYFPFGGGPRACIGQYFSMLEAILAVPVIVRSFRLSTDPGPVKLFTGITLRPNQPVPCRIEPAG